MVVELRAVLGGALLGLARTYFLLGGGKCFLDFRLDVRRRFGRGAAIGRGRNGGASDRLLVDVDKLVVDAVRRTVVGVVVRLCGHIEVATAAARRRHRRGGAAGRGRVDGRIAGAAQTVQTVHGASFLEVFEVRAERTNDAQLYERKGERKQNGRGHTIRRGGLVKGGGRGVWH